MDFLDEALVAMEDLGDYMLAQAVLMDEYRDAFAGLAECGVVEPEKIVRIMSLLGTLKEISLMTNVELSAIHAEVSEKNKLAKLLS
jgi:hypothetical protein